MRNEIRGDLLNIKSNAILVHGCNAQGVMGAGIAKQVKNMYQSSYEEYVDFLNDFENRKDSLGEISGGWVGPRESNLFLVNGITQFGCGGERPMSYDAVDGVFSKVGEIARQTGLHVYYPSIGAGLGGGEWSIIRSIIDFNLRNANHTHVVYNG
jgi:O-acetyl-ADP-ribose deacetylase (regulator of RNase III)